MLWLVRLRLVRLRLVRLRLVRLRLFSGFSIPGRVILRGQLLMCRER